MGLDGIDLVDESNHKGLRVALEKVLELCSEQALVQPCTLHQRDRK